jgi:hypothetical protein
MSSDGHPGVLQDLDPPAPPLAFSPYVPDLNPVGGAWSSMKSGLGNLTTTTVAQLAATIRKRLARIQRQPALIAEFHGQSGLTLEFQPP